MHPSESTSDYGSFYADQLAEWRAAQLSPVDVLTAPAECLACDDSGLVVVATGIGDEFGSHVTACPHCSVTVVVTNEELATERVALGRDAAAPLGGAARIDANQGDPARGEARPAGE